MTDEAYGNAGGYYSDPYYGAYGGPPPQGYSVPPPTGVPRDPYYPSDYAAHDGGYYPPHGQSYYPPAPSVSSKKDGKSSGRSRPGAGVNGPDNGLAASEGRKLFIGAISWDTTDGRQIIYLFVDMVE